MARPVKVVGAQPAATLASSAQVAVLEPGLYGITRGLENDRVEMVQGLAVPSVHLAPAPDTAAAMQLVGSPNVQGAWLVQPGDTVVVRVAPPGGRLVITSYRDGARPLDGVGIRVTRLDGVPARPPARATETLPYRVVAHLRNTGDHQFDQSGWAGLPGQRLWIEGFALLLDAPQQQIDIEYRALSVDGAMTPWVPGGAFCGSRGSSQPVLGFAVRAAATAPDLRVTYRGLFAQAGVVGPCAAGETCRSPRGPEPLEAIELTLERVVPETAPPARRRRTGRSIEPPKS